MEENILGELVPIDRFEKFRHEDGAFHAYVIDSQSMINKPTPNDNKWGSLQLDPPVMPMYLSRDDPRRENRSRIKLGDVMIMAESLPRGRSGVILSMNQAPELRIHRTDKAEMEFWEYYMKDEFNIDLIDWMTLEEYEVAKL